MKKSVALLVSSLSIFALCSDAEGMFRDIGAAKAEEAAKAGLHAKGQATTLSNHGRVLSKSASLTPKSDANAILAAIKERVKAVDGMKEGEAKKKAAYELFERVIINCSTEDEKYMGACASLDEMGNRFRSAPGLRHVLSVLSGILWNRGSAAPAALEEAGSADH